MKQFTVFIGRVNSDLPPSTLLQKYNLPPSTIKPQDTPLIYSIQTLKPPSYPVLGGLELSCLDNPLNLANLA
jgi:hypothetical protein